MVKTDVLIIGGGPAGLAAGIAVRQKGLTVTLIDAARPPIDKPCGEGLMPDGVEALANLGVRIEPQNSAAFYGIRFINGYRSASAWFPGLSGRGVRRTTLHSLMVERAAEAGVTLLWNTRFNPGELPVSRWIVAADGMNSRVRQWAGFHVAAPSARRFGFRRHFPIEPWSGTVDVHWGRDCQIYITPVAAREICVAVISRQQHLRFDEALHRFPDVEERLRGLAPTTPEGGAVTECRRLRSVTRANVALMGDASGTVDALTGEGLALAFKQAHALAGALFEGDLGQFEAAHRRIMRTPSIMANLMLRMDSRACLRRPVIAALAAQPQIFSKLLRTHIGANAPRKEQSPCVQS